MAKSKYKHRLPMKSMHGNVKSNSNCIQWGESYSWKYQIKHKPIENISLCCNLRLKVAE